MDGIQDCQKLESVHNANQPIGIERKCRKCGKIKRLTDFYKDRSKAMMRAFHCKICKNATNNIWRKNHPGAGKETTREWKRRHPEKIEVAKIKWRLAHPGRATENCRKWRADNPDKTKEIARRAYVKQVSTPRGKLRIRMRNVIRRSLAGNTKARRNWSDLVGFTADQLINHIEGQFTAGMSWENYGEWHIDHKIPVSAFHFEKPEDIDFKGCWSLKNLQPLWAVDNQQKSNKITAPFQPSLII